jgi:predicted small secreted protein
MKTDRSNAQVSRVLALTVVLAASGAAMLSAACNTVEGAATDLKAAGRATVNTTEEVFSSDSQE